MDYSKLHNPFDFANPVIDPKLFAGRKSELEDIEYYLNHAKSAPRAINLALIGDRASGKTSLLNMIEAGAKQRGFCAVRIDLDESDIETQLVFFLKLFDGIFTTACRDGAFGGIQGKTYDTYRGMIDAYEIPEDRTFCPFIFPMQYAKAMSKGNTSAPVSAAYKDDISLIFAELKKPIAILFDECDVLTHSRVHLEKLRNIFMNISGFFLVFTGTGAFFPLINDVFSPIIRQFKKINVRPFESEKETKDCIEKPLRGLGIQTEEIFDRETYKEIDAIHNLSGGRPYEIQLICHQLFKRLQQGQDTKLQLSVDVLDDVLNELQSLQDVNIRPIVQQIRNLNKDELSALGVLLMSNKIVTFEQAWYLEYLFNDDKRWKKDVLKENLNKLITKGLIKLENDILCFAGDDFDRIYCKYYSRKQGVVVNISDIPFHHRLRIGIDVIIRMKKPKVDIDKYYYDYSEDIVAEDAVSGFFNLDMEKIEQNLRLSEILYSANLEYQDQTYLPVICIALISPWGQVKAWFTLGENDSSKSEDDYIKEFNNAFNRIEERAVEAASAFWIKTFQMPVIPLEKIANHMVLVKNSRFRSRLADIHTSEMHDQYVKVQDIEGAKFHANIAYQLMPTPENINAANDLGYLFMSTGDIEKAKRLFEHAQTLAISSKNVEMTFPSRDDREYWESMEALINYNLGIVLAMKQEYQLALKLIISAMEISRESNDRMCACLFTPELAEDKLIFREVLNPDLYETAKSSIKLLENFKN